MIGDTYGLTTIRSGTTPVPRKTVHNLTPSTQGSENRSTHETPRWKRRQCIFLFLSVCGVYLCTLTDVDFYRIVDGQIMFDTAVSLHEFGELGISPQWVDHGGRIGVSDVYGKYGIGLPIAQQIPLFFANSAERSLGQGSSNIILAMLNLLLTAGAALLAALSLRELGYRFRTGALAALAFALATHAWAYIAYDFSEPLQEFCLLLALWFILRAVKSPAPSSLSWSVAGFVLGFAVLTKANLLVLIPGFAVYLWFELASPERRRVLPRFMAPLLLWGVGFAILNDHRFGSIFDFGYGQETANFSTPLLTGLYGLLFSPNKGLIFYAPLALLFPWAVKKMSRQRHREVLLLVSMVGLHVLVNSKWWSWEGGESWGPRILLPIVPIVILCVATLVESGKKFIAAFAVLFVAGVGVNLLGVLLYFQVWPVVVKLNTTRVALDVRGRPSEEYIESNGRRWFRPSTATYYLPGLSPIKGHAWLLRLRYGGTPFPLSRLEEGSPTPPTTVRFASLDIHFSLLKDRFFIAQLRSPHFWLWETLRHSTREEVFSYPAYALALEHQGDRAVAQNNAARALACYRRAAALMPNNAIPALKLANLNSQLGMPREAEQVLTQYTAYLSTHPHGADPELRRPQERAVRIRLAGLFELSGDPASARREYESVLQLKPPEADRAFIEKHLRALGVTPPQ